MNAILSIVVTGSILGRPASLVATAIGAIYNVIVAFALFGFMPTADQNATVNVALLAIIAVLATNRDSSQSQAITQAKANTKVAAVTGSDPSEPLAP